jgi:hypothetical protein
MTHGSAPVPGTGRSKLLRGMSRKMQVLVREAQTAGWHLEFAGSGHFRLPHPSGQSVVLSATSSDGRRAHLNARALLKRQMRAVPV